MESNRVSVVLAVVAGVILCGAGVYYMVHSVKAEATEKARKQQQRQTFGPFDDANSKLLGLPKPKPRDVKIR